MAPAFGGCSRQAAGANRGQPSLQRRGRAPAAIRARCCGDACRWLERPVSHPYAGRVATWDDVRRIALSLPDTDERFMHGSKGWHVHNKGFVWERPLRKADLRAFGDAAPQGPILGARVEHLQAKEALIANAPDFYFTTPHFDGYAAVLVRLERIPLDELRELIVEAWLARAPKRLARDYIATHLSDAETE
jgi:hypothetical protein